MAQRGTERRYTRSTPEGAITHPALVDEAFVSDCRNPAHHPCSDDPTNVLTLDPRLHVADGTPCEAMMTSDKARALTDEIKAATERLWALLLEAYEGRVWQALGYDSWRAWAAAELDVSQSRAYQMLDQARVIAALSEAAGVSTIVEITEGLTRQIKPRLGEAIEDVRELVAEGMPPAEAVDHVVEKYGQMPPAMVSSESPEWYTPSELVERVRQVLGHIELDPCSCEAAQRTVIANTYIDELGDGLRGDWFGTVYMNPPYGDEIGAWVTKLRAEYEAGHIEAAIALVPARVDTQWWQTVRDYPVCFIEGRLKFVGAENSAPFPSAVLYLGKAANRFVARFGEIGNVYRRISQDT